MRGILNIIMGVIFIIGGLTGKLVFIGTNNGMLLAVFGAALVALGIYRLNTRMRARG